MIQLLCLSSLITHLVFGSAGAPPAYRYARVSRAPCRLLSAACLLPSAFCLLPSASRLIGTHASRVLPVSLRPFRAQTNLFRDPGVALVPTKRDSLTPG